MLAAGCRLKEALLGNALPAPVTDPYPVKSVSQAFWLCYGSLTGSPLGGTCRTPAAVALLGRMEAALQLLAQLLGGVRLQGGTVLPMLRVACHALTTQGTDLLQLSAIGDSHSVVLVL